MIDWDDSAKMLKYCAHPVRLQILKHLLGGPCCVQETMVHIAGKALSQPNVSQHLLALKSAGLIDFRKNGAQRCYFICKPTLVIALMALLEEEHVYMECEKAVEMTNS
jgi:ArsR family transcriptional regulator